MSERFDEINPASDLAPLADALKSLTPATTGINRDRLLFESGRAAAASRLAWLWPVAAVAFACVASTLAGVMIFSERPQQVVVVERERIVEVRVPVSDDQDDSPSPAPGIGEIRHESVSPETVQMYQMRRDVLRWGEGMLPPSKPKAQGPAQSAGELERWLDLPKGTLNAPKTPRLFPQINGDD